MLRVMSNTEKQQHWQITSVFIIVPLILSMIVHTTPMVNDHKTATALCIDVTYKWKLRALPHTPDNYHRRLVMCFIHHTKYTAATNTPTTTHHTTTTVATAATASTFCLCLTGLSYLEVLHTRLGARELLHQVVHRPNAQSTLSTHSK